MRTAQGNGLAPSLGFERDGQVELMVFSDDWGRHPSSCQHLIRHLLADHPVTWFNTIGTRPPRLDLLTVRRGFEKLRIWLRRKAVEGPSEMTNPRVLNPAMWPRFGPRLGRPLNRLLLTRACRAVPRTSQTRVAITTVPIVADLIGRVPVDRWIYYCVDDLAQWPGLDRESLDPMERELIAHTDRIVAVSQTLVERMASFGREATLLTHGVDLDHWTAKGSGRIEALERVPKPWVVFWGVVDRRLDLPFLAELSRRLEPGTVVLIGPENNPHRDLATLPNTVRLGPLPYGDLPHVARDSAVLIMPYTDSPATRAIQPLKLKEYLATGKPVVVSSIPAVSEWRDACDVTTSARDFADRVLERLAAGVPAEQEIARSRLEQESWQHKAETLRRLIEANG